MRRFGQGPLPLRWCAIAAVSVPHRYLLLMWTAWFAWSGSGPPPLLWRAAASASVLSQVRWYSMGDGFFYAALALYVLVVAAYYGQLNVVFRGPVPFRRAEAAPLLPSTAQPNYWPLPVSEGIGGGLESGGIGTPEGRGMQQERIENDGDLLYFPVILRCWRHRLYLHRGVHSAPAGLDASGVCTALA